MEKSTLEEKKASVEQIFNALQDEKTKLQTRINEIDTECFKLSGEFRLVDELLTKWVDKIEGELVNGRRKSSRSTVISK